MTPLERNTAIDLRTVNPDEIDRMLVDELNELTFNEREQLLEEVHGVSSADKGEGRLFVENALKRMQEELDLHFYKACHSHNCNEETMPQNSMNDRHVYFKPFSFVAGQEIICTAYREARLKNSSLITDPLFMRGHLLAENFDPKAAATRMMIYLERMKELYETSAVLFRPIFIDDMHIKAREQLVMGSYQILPDRDSSGRRVFCYLRDICATTVSAQHRAQVYMYFKQKDVEEKVGMIAVVFLHNSTLFTGVEGTAKIYEQSIRMVECIPARYEAIHICMPNEPFYNLIKSTIILLMGKENRLHVRVHLGSHLECRYSLSTFGIPVNRLPAALDLNTTLRKDNITYHTKWLKMQKAKELEIEKIHFERCQNSSFSLEDESDTSVFASTTPTQKGIGMEAVNIFRSEFIECPRHEDCLFGRGRNVMKHPGNVAMRSLLEAKRERYASAAHQKKSEVAWEVVNEIKMGGGRFLKELDSGLYTPVEDETARKKISIAFRDLKTKVGKRVSAQAQQPKEHKYQNGHNGKSNRTPKRRKVFCGNENHSISLNSSDSESDCYQTCL